MEVVAERYVKRELPEAMDEEENDVVEQLVKRESKHRIATSFDSEGGESVISEVSEIEEPKVETLSFGEAEDIKNDLNHGELPPADLGLSALNVYFDNASGTEFSNGTSGVESKSSYRSVSEDGSVIQSSEVTEESVTTTIQGGRTITTTQHKTTKDVGTEPVYHSSQSVQANGSHTQHPSLSSADVNGNAHFHFGNLSGPDYHIKRENSGELGDLLEDDPEPIDYNVEWVLKKQETHNLICPNCKKCITGRVGLRKRKRVIKDGQRGPKRDKTEITVDSGSAIRHPAEISQDTRDESPAITVDTAHGQNEVITCWSCFSLLIPSGNGFKLFKVFGSKKQPEVVSTPNPNQTPLLTSDSGGMLVNQGNTAKAVQLGNESTVDQKTNSSKKGGHYKLFSSYGNSRDENVNSSRQTSTTQTSQVTTSSVTTNAQGTTMSNHVEGTTTTNTKQTNGAENSTQTNSSSVSTKGVSSAGADYSTTHTYHSVEGQTTEAGSNLQNGSSTVSYSRDEYQIKVNDKPDSDLDSLKDRERFKSEDIVSALQGSTLLDNLVTDSEKGSTGTSIKGRDDVRISIKNEVKQDVPSENVSRDIVIPGTGTQSHGRAPIVPVGEARDWDILKSIVYGGLIESITSLGVVSSAAGSETATVNVLALGLANLIGGLIIIFHNLKDLKKSALEGPSNEVDRYYETLGRRNNITLHAVVVVLSFIIFGMIPIVTYAFTFRTSDNRDYKSLAVIGASLLCIMLLSIGKAHIKNSPRTTRSYFNSITYYLSIAVAASGLSYVAGKLLEELIKKTGWFDTTSTVTSIFPNTIIPSNPAWGSY